MPTWVFDVTDQLTGTMHKMSVATETLTEKVGESSKALDLFAKLEIGKLAYEAPKKIFEWGKSFIEVSLGANEAEDSAKRLLAVLYGDKGMGDARNEELKRWSRQTKFTVEEVIGYQDQLFSFQKNRGEGATDAVLRAAADLATLGPGGKGKADALISTFAMMDGRAQVSGRSLMNLMTLGIVTQKSLGESIAKELGIKGPNAAKEGLKSLENGTFKTGRAMSLILATVNKDINGVKGSASASIDQALESPLVVIKNIKGLWEEMFADQDTSGISSALNNVAKAMDPASASGKQMKELFHEVFSDISKVIDYAASHMDRWVASTEKALHAVEAIVGFFASHPWLTKVVGTMGAGIAAGGAMGAVGGLGGMAAGALAGGGGGLVAGLVGATVGAVRDSNQQGQMDADTAAFRDLQARPKSALVELQADMAAQGRDIGQTTMAAINEGMQDIQLEPPSITDAIKTNEDMHSPSPRHIQIGAHVIEGLNIGMRSQPLALPGLTPRMGGFAPDAFSGLAAAHAGSGSGVSVQVTNNFMGAIPEGNKASEFAQMQAEATKNAILQAQERQAHS